MTRPVHLWLTRTVDERDELRRQDAVEARVHALGDAIPTGLYARTIVVLCGPLSVAEWKRAQAWRSRLVPGGTLTIEEPCDACGYAFDVEACGPAGCPN